MASTNTIPLVMCDTQSPSHPKTPSPPSPLIHLDIIHRPKHQINIQFLYRLRHLSNFHKIHRPEPHQQIFSLHLLFPLWYQHLPALQQSLPSHKVNLNQRLFINMPDPTSQHILHLIQLTTLPHFPVSACCPPPLPRKNLVAVPTDNLAGKWVYLGILGKSCDIMLLQIQFPSLCFQLHAFPNPRLYNRLMIILNIILLDFPLHSAPVSSS